MAIFWRKIPVLTAPAPPLPTRPARSPPSASRRRGRSPRRATGPGEHGWPPPWRRCDLGEQKGRNKNWWVNHRPFDGYSTWLITSYNCFLFLSWFLDLVLGDLVGDLNKIWTKNKWWHIALSSVSLAAESFWATIKQALSLVFPDCQQLPTEIIQPMWVDRRSFFCMLHSWWDIEQECDSSFMKFSDQPHESNSPSSEDSAFAPLCTWNWGHENMKMKRHPQIDGNVCFHYSLLESCRF